MSLKIKEEITKKIKAKVLRVVEYPTWLSSIVPVPKKDGKVREMTLLNLTTVGGCSSMELQTSKEWALERFWYQKQVEAVSYKAVTKKVVPDFVKDRIVFRFRVPESIITENATNLNSDLMKAMPQMNGVVEAANKNIKKILRKMVENNKQWHEKLPFALLGYRTTVCTLTWETPYLLVYGTEVVIPAEVEIPSLRIIHEAELSDAEWIWSRYEQLAFIDRKRMNAVCHSQHYQNRMSRAFNKRVKPRQFAPGQLVLKKIFSHQDEAKGKFSPNWQGSYIGHRVQIGGALTCKNGRRSLDKTNQFRRC
ncbi:uncharacterized protein [Nicotiana sylvestris]|uniref:uncharacterized protein n=1 Tax=Nicotiana sylvestris TaxID=4096 RepID=UPI00388C8965